MFRFSKQQHNDLSWLRPSVKGDVGQLLASIVDRTLVSCDIPSTQGNRRADACDFLARRLKRSDLASFIDPQLNRH